MMLPSDRLNGAREIFAIAGERSKRRPATEDHVGTVVPVAWATSAMAAKSTQFSILFRAVRSAT